MQRNNFKGRYVASDSSSGLTIPNTTKVAEAYGLKTYRISNNSEVVTGIAATLAMEGPCLCAVMIDPDQIVQPKVISRMGPNGTMIPGDLDHMAPFDGDRC